MLIRFFFDRIIQAYAIKEDTGAFTSEAQDAIKVKDF